MALSKGKQVRKSVGENVGSAGQLGNSIIYAGGIVMLDTAGRAKAGATETSSIGVGVAVTNRDLDRYDATATGPLGQLADNIQTVRWDEGIFCFVNSGTNPFLATDQPGLIAYIEDDQTISKLGTGKSAAGFFDHLDADGVWVDMSKVKGALAKDMITVTDAAAMHLAGIETVTGVKTFSAAPVIGAGLTASGAVANDFSGATGTFKTSTGLNTIGGDLLLASGKIAGFGAPQALSGPGACDVVSLVTNFTSTGGAQALTLANGSQAGQLKVVHHTVDGGSGVLTPATAGNFATFTLTNVHDAALFQWTGAAWNIVLNVGGTVA